MNGVFIRENEISVNWLLTQVLTSNEKLQITKISNDDVERFLYLLDNSDLRMPNGQHSLIWLKDKLKEKQSMAESKSGETWFKVTERYRFLLEQIDMTLIKSGNIKEKMEIKVEEEIIFNRTPNKMSAKFGSDKDINKGEEE